MIVDTSALLAVLFGEPYAERYEKAIAQGPCRMSVVGLLEAAMVLEGRGGAAAGEELDAFIETAGIELAPVTVEQAQAARRAWRRFGRGDQPARLNLGDCFAYALADMSGEPLLFKGKDFARTDIETA